jgi:hypothetical protein
MNSLMLLRNSGGKPKKVDHVAVCCILKAALAVMIMLVRVKPQLMLLSI